MPRTAILYMAHHQTETLIGEFLALQSECQGRGYDVVLLYDATVAPPPEVRDADVYPFDLRSVAAMGFPMMSHGGRPPAIVPGHADLPLLQFQASHPTYDYYWLVEYDVRYTGSWADFFDVRGRTEADLLATHVQRFRDNPRWCWWDSLRYKDRPIAKDDLVRAFFPIYRLSGSACRILADEYRRGWTGHFEVKLATVLAKSGCVLEDIGGEGEFVPPGGENQYYIGEESRTGLEATFRWRPVMPRPGHSPDTLWHPVKGRPLAMGRHRAGR